MCVDGMPVQAAGMQGPPPIHTSTYTISWIICELLVCVGGLRVQAAGMQSPPPAHTSTYTHSLI